MFSPSRFAAACIAGLSLFSVEAAPAWASQPSAIYTVPSRVDFYPDEANATSVAIHGAFFFYQASGAYATPSCGYMYFACPAGSEKMCRMQWADIKASIGQPQCVGFGPQSTVSKANLRTVGTPLANPDTWDLGIGVTPGTYVGGQCAPAQALKCQVTSDVDMASSPVDMAGPSNPPGPGGGGGGGGGGSGGGGCAMAPWHLGSGAASVGGLALVLATAISRRRRRR